MAADHHTLPERRAEQRRQALDRRQAIRFEPAKNPRRNSKDRRNHGKSIWDGRDGF